MPLWRYVCCVDGDFRSSELTIVDEELKLQRGGEKGTSPRYRCKHAEQSPEENLQKFRDMRDGKYKPKEAFLRMKQDVRGLPSCCMF